MIIPKSGTMLAPMKALTQAPFWRVLRNYGSPDCYVSEFVRVHDNFLVDAEFVEQCIESSYPTPVIIQLMGNQEDALVKNIEFLQKFKIAGIDFNAGCSVPKIYKKFAGGGLLKDLKLLKNLLIACRRACSINFSVKTRIGFDSTDNFEDILSVFEDVNPDLVTIHARTVKELYSGLPHFECIKKAVEKLSVPVVANGSICSVDDIENVFDFTKCYGVMLGRSVIKNPLIFFQKNNKNCKNFTRHEMFLYLKLIAKEFSWNLNISLGNLKRFSMYIFENIEENLFSKLKRCENLNDFWKTCEEICNI